MSFAYLADSGVLRRSLPGLSTGFVLFNRARGRTPRANATYRPGCYLEKIRRMGKGYEPYQNRILFASNQNKEHPGNSKKILQPCDDQKGAEIQVEA